MCTAREKILAKTFYTHEGLRLMGLGLGVNKNVSGHPNVFKTKKLLNGINKKNQQKAYPISQAHF